MPTSATEIPGVERVNWMARCASVVRPGICWPHRGHFAEHARLRKRGAGHDGDPQARGRREDVVGPRSVSFHHPEIEGQLDEAEVVLRAAFLARDGGQARQTERAFHPKAVPRGGAVPADLAPATRRSSSANAQRIAALELRGSARAELRFGIVKIEHVDGVDAQVGAAAFDLVGQKMRRHGVHALENVLGRSEAGTAPGVRNPAFVQTTISSRASWRSAAPIARSER
jgi:hypothetical protein